MKPYTTQATDQPHSNTHRAPEDFTAKRLKALALFAVSGGLVVVGRWLMDITGWPGFMVAAFVLAVFGAVAGILLWEYSNRLVAQVLPRNPSTKATKTGDTWRIHLKRELPVGNVGAVEMEPDTVDLPVEPSQFVNIVRQMQRTGTSRDKRPAGVSQPLWRKVMAALESLDGAVKGPNGYEFTDDLDALLRDIDQW